MRTSLERSSGIKDASANREHSGSDEDHGHNRSSPNIHVAAVMSQTKKKA